MFVVTSQDARYLSNSYLVAEKEGGAAVLIDGGTPTAPIHAAVEEHGLTPTHLFVTHRHPDHIAHVREYRNRYDILIHGHSAESQACGGFDVLLEGNETFESGELVVRALHIPGHTAGHMAFFVADEALFTGDTLFKGSVGGTLGQGHTTFEDLRHSILEVILKLPPTTTIYPGHTVPSSVATELEENLFVRAWRSPGELEEQSASYNGDNVMLLLRAPDYDGGTKCWIRSASGQLDVVAGSRVTIHPK
ncbi:MAG: hydroxyacylglutathione hydrolase [Planctomycetota bacterium]|jgi:hydroxyacylglutathione hydrolase